jgi:hypothetical protein
LQLGHLFKVGHEEGEDTMAPTLDDINDELVNFGSGERMPWRRSGINMVLNIEYVNTVPFNFFRSTLQGGGAQVDLYYTYTIDVLPSAMYQIESTRPLDHRVPPHERVRKRERGINVVVNARASIGAFDPQTFIVWLVQIVTFLGIVERFMGQVITSEFIVDKRTAELNKSYQYDYTEHRDLLSDKEMEMVLEARRNLMDHDTILYSHGIRRGEMHDDLLEEDASVISEFE